MLAGLARLALLGVLVVVYADPVKTIEALQLADYVHLTEFQEHLVRLGLTAFAYVRAMTRANSWLFLSLLLIALQTTCWASMLSGKRVLVRIWSDLDEAAELEALRSVAVGLYALLLLVVLFGGRRESAAKKQYRRRLIAFYKTHNPDRLSNVEKILRKYDGNEELLFQRLQRKYSILTHTKVEEAVDQFSSSNDEASAVQNQEEQEQAEADYSAASVHPEPSTPATPMFEPVSHESRSPLRSESPWSDRSHTPSPTSDSPPPFKSNSSTRVRAAIEEARRAQEERVQQRIAQLMAAHSSTTL